MRIVELCPYSLDTPGGVATHVLGLSSWLSTRGHDVTILAPGHAPTSGVTTRLVGSATPIAFNGSVAQLALRPRQVAEGRQICSAADVVHVHEPLTPGLAYGCAIRSQHLVVTHHASFRLPAPLKQLLRHRASRFRPATSIAVSAAAATTATAVTGREPQVIPNGLDVAGYCDQNVVRDPKQVLFVGRSDDPRKGFDVFCAAARLSAENGDGIRFVAAGPGRVREPAVTQLGLLTHPDLVHQLNSSAVLVAPNIYGESFGMILVEGLAAGCNIVASDLPAFDDLVGSLPGAALVAPRDPVELLTQIRHALSFPTAESQLRSAARKFDWSVVGPLVEAQLSAATR